MHRAEESDYIRGNSMEIKVKVTGRELYRFALYHLLHSPTICFYLTLLAVFLVIRHFSTDYDPEVMNLVLMIFAGYAIFYIFRLRYKAEQKANHPQHGAEITYKIEYGGIRVRQGSEISVLKWEDVMEVKKIAEMYVIYPAPRCGLLVPRRVFVKAKEERFLKLLEQHMSEKQLKKLHLKKNGERK